MVSKFHLHQKRFTGFQQNWLKKKGTDLNDKKKKIKIDHIKIVDFDKERMNEKIRTKLMERRGMKSIKIRYFD